MQKASALASGPRPIEDFAKEHFAKDWSSGLWADGLLRVAWVDELHIDVMLCMHVHSRQLLHVHTRVILLYSIGCCYTTIAIMHHDCTTESCVISILYLIRTLIVRHIAPRYTCDYKDVLGVHISAPSSRPGPSSPRIRT